MLTKTLVDRWQSRGGKYWLELWQETVADCAPAYSYRSDNGGGYLGHCSLVVAQERMNAERSYFPSVLHLQEKEGNQMTTVKAFWALCYHSNSRSPRAKKWYYVSRAFEVDGKTYQVGPWFHAGSDSLAVLGAAAAAKRDIAPGIWASPAGQHLANEIVRTK